MKKNLPIERDSDIEKYVKSLQFVIDGWAALRTAAVITETESETSRKEFHDAVHAYLVSNPVLDLRDFGFMCILLKQREYPEEIIEDIAHYFAVGASLQSLIEAYRPRG